MYKNPFFLLSSSDVRRFIRQEKNLSSSISEALRIASIELEGSVHSRPPCPMKEHPERAGSALEFERAGVSHPPAFLAG